METTRNRTTQVIRPALLTFEQYLIIIETCSMVGIVLASLGVVSNIINIKTFIAMGLSDGVTVSFLALAIFDLTYLMTSMCLSVTVTFYITEYTSGAYYPIEPFGIFIYFGTIMILINVTNVLTTTFLAVARSMCVAMPLQFKNTFTRDRAVMFMIGFAVFAIGIYTPILANMGMEVKFDKLANKSRLVLWVSASRETVKEAVWMVTELFLPVITQFIILVCVVIMSSSLRAATRFRQASTSGYKMEVYKNLTKRKASENDPVSDTNINTDKLSGKELRVVQQVVLICVVYIVCNVPKIIIIIVAAVEPEFAIGRSYTFLYLSANGLRKPFEVVNAAVNLLVYYKYNTKFRLTLCR